ncbi:MAG: hypothetical protein IPI77_20010, partial [Saprospiraceae bacterium]|nr:hypothetical protein [Saprospiraceae bacterium]
IVMRGKISHGYFADLVIIDLTWCEIALHFKDPFALSEGIEQSISMAGRVWTEAPVNVNINPG